MGQDTEHYLMENVEETFRLELKTDPHAVREQARWCGLRPGMRVLDAGCGPGLVTAILHEMLQPEGEIIGIDFSEDRIRHAKKEYGGKPTIHFRQHDLKKPMPELGSFDLVWSRFVLEYHRLESSAIVKNLADSLKPGGMMCLMDLDHNCLNHYELSPEIEKVLFALISELEQKHDFDPYAGRKLYAYLYDLGFQDIELHLVAHHLIYGKAGEAEIFNWYKKVDVASAKAERLFKDFPGGRYGFLKKFKEFFLGARRFTYTPLILCKGVKPSSCDTP